MIYSFSKYGNLSKFLPRVLLVLSIFSLTACGGDDKSSDESSQQNVVTSKDEITSEDTVTSDDTATTDDTTTSDDTATTDDTTDQSDTEDTSNDDQSVPLTPYSQAEQERVISFITVEGSNLGWDQGKVDKALDIIGPYPEEPSPSLFEKLSTRLGLPEIKLPTLDLPGIKFPTPDLSGLNLPKLDLSSTRLRIEKIVRPRLEATGVRVVIPWDELQLTIDGGFDGEKTAFYNELISKILDAGLEPMVVFGRAPQWLDDKILSEQEIQSQVTAYLNWVFLQVIDPQANIRHIQLWDEDKQDQDFIYGEFTPVALVTIGNYVRTAMPGARTYLGINADKKEWLDVANGLMSKPEVNSVVDVVGINYYSSAKNLVSGLSMWKPLEALTAEINNPTSPIYGKMGAVLETGFSTYAPGHGAIAQQLWIKTSLRKMASVIKESALKNDHKIVAWNWNRFADTPWKGVKEEGWAGSHYGITKNSLGLFGKKVGFGALKEKISKVNDIELHPGNIAEEKRGLEKLVEIFGLDKIRNRFGKLGG